MEKKKNFEFFRETRNWCKKMLFGLSKIQIWASEPLKIRCPSKDVNYILTGPGVKVRVWNDESCLTSSYLTISFFFFRVLNILNEFSLVFRLQSFKIATWQKSVKICEFWVKIRKNSSNWKEIENFSWWKLSGEFTGKSTSNSSSYCLTNSYLTNFFSSFEHIERIFASFSTLLLHLLLSAWQCRASFNLANFFRPNSNFS